MSTVWIRDGRKTLYFSDGEESGKEGSLENPKLVKRIVVSGCPYATGKVILLDPETGYLSFRELDGRIRYYEDGIWKSSSYEVDYEIRERLRNEVAKRVKAMGYDPHNPNVRKQISNSRDYYTVRNPDKVIYSLASQYISDSILDKAVRTWDTATIKNCTIDKFIECIQTADDRRFLSRRYGGKYEDFVLSVDNPIFRRAEENTKKNTFDFIDITVVLRSTATKEDVIRNKQEIFEKTINKIENYKPYKRYGVPVAFLKMYQFTLHKGGVVTISFCLKDIKEDEDDSN